MHTNVRTARALRGAAGLLEPLESRVHLSSTFAYEPLPGVLDPAAPMWVLRPGGDDTSARAIGSSVAAAGDVDADGYADIIAGAGGGGSGGEQARAFAVVYSGRTGLPIHTFSDGFTEFGASVAGVGDVNGDGRPDLLVGSPRWSADGGPLSVGRAYLYSGLDGSVIRTFDGAAATDRLGFSVAGAGDVNKDGVPDVIIGAPGADRNGTDRGRAEVYSGADGTLLWRFLGFAITDDARVGWSVAGGGDINDDGYADLIVGAPGATSGRIDAPGTVFVYSGKTGATLWTFARGQPRDEFGFAVASAGDVNNDGHDDLIIGAPSADGQGTGTVPSGGRVAVYSGGDGHLLYEFFGDRPNGNLGASVAGVGDLNGDDHADFMFGRPAANPDAKVEVRSGIDGGLLASFTARDLSLVGGDRLGRSIAAAGDVDKDGFVDFVFAATQDANPDKNDRSRAYVFSGARAAGLIPQGLNDARDIWGTAGGRGWVILRGELFALPARDGFLAGDRVVDINDNHTILGVDKDGAPFLWTSSGRAALSGLIENYEGPDGDFTGLRAVDLTDGGLILLERLRDGDAPTTWMYEDGTARYLFDGVPVAMNEARLVLGVPAAVENQSILWMPGADEPDVINGLAGVDLNELGDFVGRVTGTGPALWSGGTVTPLGVLPGGTAYTPTALNDARQVVGYYTSGGKTAGFYYDPTDALSAFAPLVTYGAPESLAAADDLRLVDINNHGVIAGHHDGVGFLAGQYNTLGPYDTSPGSRATAVVAADGGVTVAVTNRAGEVVFFRRDAQGNWTAQDLTAGGQTASATDAVSFIDPQTGRAAVAAATADGVLVLTTDETGAWSARNLTGTLPGATPIVRGMTTFTSIDNEVFIAGANADNDVVIYRNAAGNWTYTNLYEAFLRPGGLPTPQFNSRLNSYVTSWNGLNISGLDESGHIWSVWTAPGMNGWSASDLSDITGAPELTGSLTTYVTDWGGINILGIDANGETTVTWWVPEFGGEWRQNNFTREFGGPALVPGSVTSYVTPWDGLNVAGLDRDGNIVSYWWVPGFDKWNVDTLPVGGDRLDRPVGRLESNAGPDGSINLVGINRNGHVMRAHWAPGQEWTMDDLTQSTMG